MNFQQQAIAEVNKQIEDYRRFVAKFKPLLDQVAAHVASIQEMGKRVERIRQVNRLTPDDIAKAVTRDGELSPDIVERAEYERASDRPALVEKIFEMNRQAKNLSDE